MVEKHIRVYNSNRKIYIKYLTATIRPGKIILDCEKTTKTYGFR